MRMRKELNLNEYQYDLPERLIAQDPLQKRDQARLLILERKTGRLFHDKFFNIGCYLPKKSCLVFNRSKVLPVRLLGHREERTGCVEVFLLKKQLDGYNYEVLMRPMRKLKNGDRIYFNGNGIVAQVWDRDKRLVRFNKRNIDSYLERTGHMPLPPYIKRTDNLLDRKYYQTVYAKHPGSVAAPTAGLHFTQKLLNNLQRQGHSVKFVTLHINYATFKPVEQQNISKHSMHKEEYSIARQTFQSIQKAKDKGRKVVAVGTTSTRVLETVCLTGQMKGETSIYIYPGFDFRGIDSLITNFHLPCSTLLMLVSAFATRKLIMRVYQEAIEKKYRFYSYGDAMLII